MPDPALVYQDTRYAGGAAPGTHVIVVGVGHYAFGKKGVSGPGRGLASDLSQLTSAPITARAVKDWFLQSFNSSEAPLASVSLVISEEPALPNIATADLAGVQAAVKAWSKRVEAHPGNMAIFYFCGHGLSSGNEAALLLRDFGDPADPVKGAINVMPLIGTMRNSNAVKQLFLLDCCRSVDDQKAYENVGAIGSTLITLLRAERVHADPAQQFVLFPTLDGEEAFGVKDHVSTFGRSIIDALSFAAADRGTGTWSINTATILREVGRLIAARVPDSYVTRSIPNSPNATPFVVHELPKLDVARAIVVLSDMQQWGRADLECCDTSGQRQQRIDTSTIVGDRCGTFDVDRGVWRFSGRVPRPAWIQTREQFVDLPVAYVKLKVV